MIESWVCQGFDQRPEGQYQGHIEDQDKLNEYILQAGEQNIGNYVGAIKDKYQEI